MRPLVNLIIGKLNFNFIAETELLSEFLKGRVRSYCEIKILCGEIGGWQIM